MAVRGIRGATRVTRDDPDEIREAIVELMSAMLERNSLNTDALISVLFTATPDLVSTFPAAAARTLGLGDVPLLCTVELNIIGALDKVLRVLAHVETDLARPDISHVYLRGAEVLRVDLAQ